MMINVKSAQRFLAATFIAATLSIGAAHANPISVQVDVTGIADNDERGAASNIIRDVYVGAMASITGLAWNVNLTSYPGSYLSEMQVTFSDTIGNGITFTPGNGDDFDGTQDYAGSKVGSDGILRLEFHDVYKDLAFDEPEGMWNSGTLTFNVAEVPEPPTYALMLGGLLLAASAVQRRRS